MTSPQISSMNNRRLWFWLALIATLLALFLRNLFRGFVSYDFLYFYLPWSEHLEAHGGFAGIPSLQSDYTVAYQYILAALTYLPASYLAKVKVVSVFFDLVNAALICQIVKKSLIPPARMDRAYQAYIVTLFIPTVFLNSAVWGQCDAIYTAFVLACILAIQHKRYIFAFLAYGLALVFKLQAIFFLPVLCLLLLKNRHVRIWHFLLIPAVNLLVYLPALLLGKPIKHILDVYVLQVTQYSDLTRCFPSLWQWIASEQPWMNNVAIIFTFAVLGLVYLAILRKKELLIEGVKLLEISILTVMLCLLLLPSMHERYMYIADVLAAAYIILQPKKWFIPLFIWLCSLVGYLDVLFGFKSLMAYKGFALVLLTACLLLIRSLFAHTNTQANQG